MSGQSVYFGLVLATFFGLTMSTENPVTVEAHVQMQVGNTGGDDVFVFNSETYTQLTLNDEELGFAVKLSNSEKGREIFEVIPTYHKIPIVKDIHTRKNMTFIEGNNFNGYQFEKTLALTFLSVKRLP